MWKVSLVLMVLAGCTDVHDSGPTRTNAEKAFIAEALPVLQQHCAACHSSPTDGIGFMAGTTAAEMRQSLLESIVVDLDQVTSSRILTKGAHSGPAMTAAQTSAILEWLTAERDEQ